MKIFLICSLIFFSITTNLYAQDCSYITLENIAQCSGTTNDFYIDVDDDPSSFTEPQVMEDSNEETFKLVDLLGTSLNGVLDTTCGGYCLTGFCAHLNIGFSLTKGLYYYTIISPKIQHALPELLISAYDGVGREPFKEWRDTYGQVMKAANEGFVSNFLRTPDGLQGSQTGRPINQGTTNKEIDIIGHPLAMLPGLVNEGDDNEDSRPYQMPTYRTTANASQEETLTVATEDAQEDTGMTFGPDGFNLNRLSDFTGSLSNKVSDGMGALDAVNAIEDFKSLAQTMKNIKTTMNTALATAETTTRASFWGNFLNPRFKMPRLFCTTYVKAFQPYYMSFLDSFWWRSGYPLTDGPISGSDHTNTIFNPVSLDTLQTVESITEVMTSEIWGHLYPRDGSIAQTHDGKAASVIAWRGLDVLKTAVKDGYRVGVVVPESPDLHSEPDPKWQMIFPQVQQCQDDPYYEQNDELHIDSVKPSVHGGYAWNYYRTYNCCSNTKGTELTGVDIVKLCIPLDDVLNGIDEDRSDYEEYLRQLEEQNGGN